MRRRPAALVARRLGLAPEDAGALLAAMRARVGSRQLALRVAAFGLAASGAGARVLPAGFRRRAIAGLVGPLLETPAALNAYAGGRAQPVADPCRGLVQEG